MKIIVERWLSPHEYEIISDQGRKMLMRQRSLIPILKRTFDDIASSMLIHDNTFLYDTVFPMTVVGGYQCKTHLNLTMYLHIDYTVSITFSESISYKSDLSNWEVIFWETGDENDDYYANVYSANGNKEVVEKIKTFVKEHTNN